MTLPLIFAATSDISGKVRGKAFPADQLDKRLQRGVGWTPTNVQMTCFDGIADSPFGALGDLLLIPDPTTEARATFAGVTEHFMLGDIVTLDGEPWAFCTRAILRKALKRLHEVAGVHLISAFEHEFQLKDAPLLENQGYGREGFELQRRLCETLMATLAKNDIAPDSIMKEFGANQYEVVVGPAKGVRSADEAVILREFTRSTARSLGEAATFTPIRDVASVGNGVHIHMSFVDDDGSPVTYDADGPCGMSKITGSFAAGVLKYLPNILAITAPSVISYERLTPHRWSAAYNNLGFRDREASLRVCPVTGKDPASIARQFNIEFRASDAAASPYMALAAVVHAGTQGIEDGLKAPVPTEEDLSLLPPGDLAQKGLVRLPETLDAALEAFRSDTIVTGWFGPEFEAVYSAHKADEIDTVKDMDTPEKCTAYEGTY
ncbi:glutamine synthetase [Rhodophyticola sp. CCM32]|uniref:glutamine synthetase family protein n=1 Tax=Rhodophyticola sp. CCM32 TaxID=2916397 RepID=UPI00107F0C95|nr:glutamine synthetase family protein [Rhodophyticola sp. CCM32]QBX99909.1 glutamine synthetase [Rhodophyticola sp. CCM32]